MHISDIENDIARGDVRGIEDGFRALVGWPIEAKVEGGTRALRRALRSCCLNLHSDDSIMPGHITEMISEAAGEPVGGTYHDGAQAVLDRIKFWTMRINSKTGEAA